MEELAINQPRTTAVDYQVVTATMDAISSIAVAGAWGYIGRKFVDASLALGLRVYVYDPGGAPLDLDLGAVRRVLDEEEVYRLDVDLFHLALHPQHRRVALTKLLDRARVEPLLILGEKPMAAPEQPDDCAALVEAVRNTRAALLFDFPELYDPMTARIVEHLAGFDEVVIDEIHIQRSKDREDPDNPRNRKTMVHIQFQESVHCLAFILHLLGRVRGGVASALADGLAVSASAEPYVPPNPDDYPYVVDGRCEFELKFGATAVHGHTDFKPHAPFRKKRIIRGAGDGRPFEIEVDYLEGAKYLLINGVDQGCDRAGSSYEAVVTTLGKWRRERRWEELMTAAYPSPAFAHLTYQLSGALWRSCWDGRRIELANQSQLLAFDSGIADRRLSV